MGWETLFMDGIFLGGYNSLGGSYIPVEQKYFASDHQQDFLIIVKQ